MTDKNFVEIVAVVDRSGSMMEMRNEAVSGFNSFLAEQKAFGGRADFTLVLFNHKYLLKHDGVAIETVPPLDRDSYVPEGTTALLDAVGRTIDDVGQRLAETPEEDRPRRVIFCILTDGRENASQDYDYERVRKMVTHQEQKYDWKFQYLAQGLGAFNQARDLGLAHVATSYDPSRQGTQTMYAAASAMTIKARLEDEDSDDTEVT